MVLPQQNPVRPVRPVRSAELNALPAAADGPQHEVAVRPQRVVHVDQRAPMPGSRAAAKDPTRSRAPGSPSLGSSGIEHGSKWMKMGQKWDENGPNAK